MSTDDCKQIENAIVSLGAKAATASTATTTTTSNLTNGANCTRGNSSSSSSSNSHGAATNGVCGTDDDTTYSTASVSVKTARTFTSGQKDILRLIGQHLRHLGLDRATDALIAESGCMLEHPIAATFTRLIMNGCWSEAEQALHKLRTVMSLEEADKDEPDEPDAGEHVASHKIVR